MWPITELLSPALVRSGLGPLGCCAIIAPVFGSEEGRLAKVKDESVFILFASA